MVKLNKDGDGYLNLYEVQFDCPECGRRQETYEVPVGHLCEEELECIGCDATLVVRTDVEILVDASVKRGS